MYLTINQHAKGNRYSQFLWQPHLSCQPGWPWAHGSRSPKLQSGAVDLTVRSEHTQPSSNLLHTAPWWHTLSKTAISATTSHDNQTTTVKKTWLQINKKIFIAQLFLLFDDQAKNKKNKSLMMCHYTKFGCKSSTVHKIRGEMEESCSWKCSTLQIWVAYHSVLHRILSRCKTWDILQKHRQLDLLNPIYNPPPLPNQLYYWGKELQSKKSVLKRDTKTTNQTTILLSKSSNV